MANSFESTQNVSPDASKSKHDFGESNISTSMEYTFTPCSSQDQEVYSKRPKSLNQLFMNASGNMNTYVHKKKNINLPDTTQIKYSPSITMNSDLPSL